MPKKYGLIYQGSKDKLADRILRHIPSADCFVDLFAGGCSMTHAALLSGRYKRVIANDVSDIPQVFVNAAKGMYDNEDRWISREEFYELREKDPFVRLVWSFSNNLNDYIYGREAEPFKKALHWAVCYRDPEPLKEYGIDVSEAMTIEDRYNRWLTVKRICENREGQTRLQSAEGANILAKLSGNQNVIRIGGGGGQTSTLTRERTASRKFPANAGFRNADCQQASDAVGCPNWTSAR